LGAVSAQGQPATDRYGDPLPEGAWARVGTARLRHGGWIPTAIFSPDGKLLATGGADQIVRLWDADTGKKLRELSGHGHAVMGLSWSRDGKFLAAVTGNGPILLWEPAGGKLLRTVSDKDYRHRSVAFSPDGKLLAASTVHHS